MPEESTKYSGFHGNSQRAIFFLLRTVALVVITRNLAMGTSLAFGTVISSAAQATSPSGSAGSPLEPHIKALWDDVFAAQYGQWPNAPYPGDGVTGICTDAQLAVYAQENKDLCSNPENKPLKCTKRNMDCATLETVRNNRLACIVKRLEIMSVRFKGGDGPH